MSQFHNVPKCLYGDFPLNPMQLESSGSFSQIPSDPSDEAEECDHMIMSF